MNAGQQLTPTLRLVRPLGQGAMGSVWIADHLTLGTQVAVKFMAPAFAQDQGFTERFRREAMTAAQIKHPHVAHVLDHGVSSDGLLYIAMELLEGETLKSRIRRFGALSLAEVVRVVGQTAKALGRAHQLGIVHRDVKPDNLFVMDLDGEPFVKILDFGVAKLDQGNTMNATATGSMLGTPLFMSPEQLLSAKHVDHQADLWALAVVAYNALTGHLPFIGDTVGALSLAVHAGVFTPPSAFRPDLPPAVDVWMARALTRDPGARFRSAKEMSEALEQAAGMPRASMASSPAWTPPMGFAAPQHVGRQSGVSGTGDGRSSTPALGGSGANASTLQGVTTGAGGASWRAPVVLGAVMVSGLLVIGVGGFAVYRSRMSGQEAAAASSSGAAPAAAEAPEGAPAASAAAVTPSTTPELASASAGASAGSPPRGAKAAGGGASQTKPPLPDKTVSVPSTPKPVNTRSKKDDFGF
jgi:eukaryotic-like serine/threonine-protein kinase